MVSLEWFTQNKFIKNVLLRNKSIDLNTQDPMVRGKYQRIDGKECNC